MTSTDDCPTRFPRTVAWTGAASIALSLVAGVIASVPSAVLVVMLLESLLAAYACVQLIRHLSACDAWHDQHHVAHQHGALSDGVSAAP